VPVPEGPLDGLDQVRRRRESEKDGVANIQVPDLLPRSLNSLGLHDDVPDGIGELTDPARDRNSSVGGAHPAILQRSAMGS